MHSTSDASYFPASMSQAHPIASAQGALQRHSFMESICSYHLNLEQVVNACIAEACEGMQAASKMLVLGLSSSSFAQTDAAWALGLCDVMAL